MFILHKNKTFSFFSVYKRMENKRIKLISFHLKLHLNTWTKTLYTYFFLLILLNNTICDKHKNNNNNRERWIWCCLFSIYCFYITIYTIYEYQMYLQIYNTYYLVLVHTSSLLCMFFFVYFVEITSVERYPY